MSVWQNVELFVLQPSVRPEYNVQILASCQKEFECCRVLTFLTLLAFAYYSDVILRDCSSMPAIWHICVTGYVIIASLWYLSGARDRAVGIVFVDCRRGPMAGM